MSQRSESGISRRNFVQTAVAASAGLVLGGSAWAQGTTESVDELRVALIGVGSQGRALLTNALKPIVLPGENMEVKIVKEGKEAAQGLGYLNDGTMVVVENGRRYIGQTVNTVVTSVLQTNAGRMIFTKLEG